MIRLEWMEHVVQHPVREVIQADGRMKIRYFRDTDTLYIEFRTGVVIETKDLDENTQVDLDRAGNICVFTIEHAQERADLPHTAGGGR